MDIVAGLPADNSSLVRNHIVETQQKDDDASINNDLLRAHQESISRYELRLEQTREEISATNQQITSLEDYIAASSSLLCDISPTVVDLTARVNALVSLLHENASRANELHEMLQSGYRVT